MMKYYIYVLLKNNSCGAPESDHFGISIGFSYIISLPKCSLRLAPTQIVFFIYVRPYAKYSESTYKLIHFCNQITDFNMHLFCHLVAQHFAFLNS